MVVSWCVVVFAGHSFGGLLVVVVLVAVLVVGGLLISYDLLLFAGCRPDGLSVVS